MHSRQNLDGVKKRRFLMVKPTNPFPQGAYATLQESTYGAQLGVPPPTNWSFAPGHLVFRGRTPWFDRLPNETRPRPLLLADAIGSDL
jgi:hypothetical protein